MATDTARVVCLGASNLTLGFQPLLSAARSAWGPGVRVLAALGLGRSYGAASRVLFRALPGILDSGLWPALESAPSVPTRALVTDVGNDILYGFPTGRILAWVEEALNRLQRVTRDIVLTDLPLAGIGRLSPGRFMLFRSIFFPSCRLSFARVCETAAEVNFGLERLAYAHGARFFRLNSAWYGIDPIHIRPSMVRFAWCEIAGVPCQVEGSVLRSLTEGAKLGLLPPERRWLFGSSQYRPQPGVELPSGGRVSLY
jgi:hypothetical protein